MKTKALLSRLASRVRHLADDWKPSGALSVTELRDNVDRVRFRYKLDGVEGWLSASEQRALYALGRFVPGPFLEVGPFAGRSTSCIALGVKDSGAPKRFVSIDWFPELENFRQRDNGVALHIPKDAPEAFAIIPQSMYDNDFKPVLSKPGGILGTLQRNLRRFGVEELVTIQRGDFRDLAPEPFAFVFCDALHDKAEIDANGPALRSFVQPGSIVAFHDFNRENEVEIRRHLPLGESFITDLLFVSEVV